MDEACGGVPKPISSMEFDDELLQTGFEAIGEEYVELLTNEIVKYRNEADHLEKENRRIFDHVLKIFEALLEENRELMAEVDKLKDRVVSWDDEAKKMDKDLKSGLPNKLDSLTIMSFAFRAIYAEAKRVRAIWNTRDIPSHILLNSWKGVVGDEPDCSWVFKNVSHGRPLKKTIFLKKHSCQVVVLVDLPIEASRPFLRVLVKFQNDKVPKQIPMIVAKMDNQRADNGRVERLDPEQVCGGTTYHYACGRYTAQQLDIGPTCARLGLALFLELFGAAAELQSDNGVLYWTVDKFAEVFEHDDELLYSPYFATAKDQGGQRLQAVLYSKQPNELNLYVVRRGVGPLVSPDGPAQYRIVVNVLTPKGKSSFFPEKSDLKKGCNIDLGRKNVMVVGDTFLCKVMVSEAPPDPA